MLGSSSRVLVVYFLDERLLTVSNEGSYQRPRNESLKGFTCTVEDCVDRVPDSVASADLCFLCDTRLPEFVDHLKSHGVPIIDAPVSRTGALGPIQSVDFCDPDANLFEVAVYDSSA